MSEIIREEFYNHPKVRQARKLLEEAEREMRRGRKEDMCICGHKRKHHGPSFSINYTDGICHKCNCLHFIIKGKEGETDAKKKI